MAFIVGLPLVLIGILLLFRRKLLPRWLCLLLSLVLLALSVLVALGSRVVLVHFGVGRSPILLSFRMLMPAYVWPICWIGALCAFAGIVVLSVVLAGLGGVSSLIAARYINQVTKSHDAEFASAFGRDWQQRIAARTPKMLQHHWSPVRYSDSAAREERDVTFAVISETKRKLLANLSGFLHRVCHRAALRFCSFTGARGTFSIKAWGWSRRFVTLRRRAMWSWTYPTGWRRRRICWAWLAT